MDAATVQARFSTALDGLIDQVKADRSILAAILCGSLSHDVVWEKSDIDLVLVTVDDKKIPPGDLAINADGVNIHALLMSRAELRRIIDGAVHQSFIHSFLTRGRLLYTHDQTIARMCESLTRIGERDTQVQLLRAATSALPPLYKARKWFITRGDLEYTALWILYAATPLARIEVIGRGLLADREVIPQAMALNRPFFTTIYAGLLNQPKTPAAVGGALDTAEGFVAARAASLFAPILDHLRDVGEARSAREIEDHFRRTFDVEGVTTACEYLADRHLLGKAATQARITIRSNVDVQELAFFWTAAS